MAGPPTPGPLTPPPKLGHFALEKAKKLEIIQVCHQEGKNSHGSGS